MKELLVKLINFNDDAEFYGTLYGRLERDFQIRWAFWIRKFIQLNLLEDFLEIIPRS